MVLLNDVDLVVGPKLTKTRSIYVQDIRVKHAWCHFYKLYRKYWRRFMFARDVVAVALGFDTVQPDNYSYGVSGNLLYDVTLVIRIQIKKALLAE